MKGLLKDSGVFFRLIQLLLVALICSSFAIFLGAVITSGMESELAVLRTLQLLQSVFSFLVPPFILAYLWSTQPVSFLQLDKKSNWKFFLFVIVLMLVAVPFINLLADLNSKVKLPDFLSGVESIMQLLEKQAEKQTEKLLETHHWAGLLFNIFLVAIIPALGEELFFRGSLQNTLNRQISTTGAIWIAAFVFSAVHFQFYGFIPRMLIGAFFGYLLVWSGTIWLPITAHFTNNAVIVIFHYLSINGYKVPDIDKIGTGSNWWLGCICGLVFLAGLFVMRKCFSKSNIPPSLPSSETEA